MHPADQKRLLIDNHALDLLPGLMPGLEVLPLHAFGSEQVALVRWAMLHRPKPTPPQKPQDRGAKRKLALPSGQREAHQSPPEMPEGIMPLSS